MGFNPRDVVSGLQEDLSEYRGSLDPWCSVRQAAGRHMRMNCTKKLVTERAHDASLVALTKFVTSNTMCERYKLKVESSWDDELVGLVKDEIYKCWNKEGFPVLSTYDELFAECDVGPGSSVGANGADFYTKLFSSPLCATSTLLYRAYSSTIRYRPRWFSSELHRSDTYGPPTIVEGNRLSFVRKSNETDRTICIEPALNMLFQLGLGGHIRKRLLEVYHIDISNQQYVNRRLALLGSRHDSFATIDLTSASDTISISLLREILPRDFLSWLLQLRSPSCKLPSGDLLELHMISSMGNGFTFPLQTLIFSACVAAVYRQLGITRSDGRKRDHFGRSVERNWGVFGDDIIVEAKAYNRIIHLLRLFGFTPNAAKSFCEGPFRESCGVDAFKGIDIRPVFLSKLDRPHDRYIAINTLIRWSSKHGIPLPLTLSVLVKSVPGVFVPPCESDDAGIHVPLSLAKYTRDKNGSYRYRAWVVRPKFLTVYDDRIWVPRNAGRKRAYNPDGLYVTFLRGSLRESRIGLRHEVPNYYSKSRVTPNWEIPNGDPRFEGLVGQRWSTAVLLGLTT